MNVFLGYDHREDIAFKVCEHSIVSRQPDAVIHALKQKELRSQNIFWRTNDTLATTEFTITRFLVPALMQYKGWAVYADCDFLFQEDIEELFKLADPKYAVMVVKHDYNSTNTVKKNGMSQLVYPRKNWSSLILWNCQHPSNLALTLEAVNSQPSSFLHEFKWLNDSEIGELSCEWNWLVGWHKEPDNGSPKAIHYTEGGPWFENYLKTEYGAQWQIEKQDYDETVNSPNKNLKYLNLPTEINSIIDKIIQYRVDPLCEYYNITYEEIIKDIEMLNNKKAIAVMDAEDGAKLSKKGHVYDPFLENFILGSGGQITLWNKVANDMSPVVLRGLGKRKQIKECWEKGRDFYYIDTGYFGNDRKKNFHRITKNHLQNIGPLISRPRDRLSVTGWKPKKFTGGSNILLCPPSEKVMKFFNLDLQEWITETVDTIKKHTDRPIVIRTKQPRSVRVTTDTMEMALEKDVHCLVTFNSIAATEAILFGKPAFTLGPNAAQSLCLTDLSKIERPYIPTLDQVEEWAAHLSYCQFTELEMGNGTAWRILTEGL